MTKSGANTSLARGQVQVDDCPQSKAFILLQIPNHGMENPLQEAFT